MYSIADEIIYLANRVFLWYFNTFSFIVYGMTRTKRTNPDFLNGVPELLILQLLSNQPMYGYELVQAIRSRSNETLQFGEGSIYPILHRLEAEGSLASRKDLVNGRQRVVYKTTPSGKKNLAAAVGKWRAVVDSVNFVLQGGDHGSNTTMA